jgi:hypothetical protein
MPLPLLAVVGYGVSALTLASIAALRAGKAVVPRVAAYDPPPVAVLHPAIAHLRDRAEYALGWWEERKHNCGLVLGERPAGTPGIVQIIPPPPGWSRTGHIETAQIDAEFEEDEEDIDDAHEVDVVAGRIVSSRIILDPARLADASVDVARVIAHGLGHAAFGYLHVTARLGRKHAHERAVRLVIPKAGHLMHPRYSEGGWGDEGLVTEG